jgi:hypothetical protein
MGMVGAANCETDEMSGQTWILDLQDQCPKSSDASGLSNVRFCQKRLIVYLKFPHRFIMYNQW